MKDEFVESVVLSPRDVQIDVPLVRRLLAKWGYFDAQRAQGESSPAAPASAAAPAHEGGGGR